VDNDDIKQLNEKIQFCKDRLDKKLAEEERKVLEIASFEEEIKRGEFIDIDIVENVGNCEFNNEINVNNGEYNGNENKNNNNDINVISNNIDDVIRYDNDDDKKKNINHSRKIISN